MKATAIYDKSHRWIMFGRDPDKVGGIIDTNQYMIITRNHAFILDPGGIELFSSMLASILHFVPLDKITHLFASHQDPDIISSLGLWDQTLPNAKLMAPWMWEGFIRHFGCENIHYVSLPDQGATLRLDEVEFEFVPAHYLHSSGNFNVYDPQARILMSGDIGSALEKDGSPLFVDNFKEHVSKMQLFHQRWMPSNTAKNAWVERVRKLDVDILAPQHGRLFQGDDVKRFLDWFESLEVGLAKEGEYMSEKKIELT